MTAEEVVIVAFGVACVIGLVIMGVVGVAGWFGPGPPQDVEGERRSHDPGAPRPR